MGSLGAASRRSLAERGIVSRLYAADDEALLLSDPGSGSYALLDEGDHIRIRSLRPGLDLLSALVSSLVQAETLGSSLPFAQRSGVGWICSRLDNCGLGASLSVLVHIPGLIATGMRERLFRALMAEGLVLRGFYSTAEESAASVYEICSEGTEFGGESSASLRGLCDRLTRAIDKVVDAERRSREEFQDRGRDELLDAEGRAYGILLNCRLLEAEEAASLLSTLRFAALRGSLMGADPRALGSRMLALGPGSVSLASAEPAEPGLNERSLRASLIKRELSKTDYKSEVDSLCSKA
jgi:protein arginine kinase